MNRGSYQVLGKVQQSGETGLNEPRPDGQRSRENRKAGQRLQRHGQRHDGELRAEFAQQRHRHLHQHGRGQHRRGKFDGGDFGYDGRLKSGLVVVDPATGSVVRRKEMPYANTSGALATAGGIIVTALIDGTVVVLDDQTLDELWSFNVGTGINAPPMTYAVDGRQYIAIATGLTRNSMGRLATTPEKRNLGKTATMIFVFAL